MTTVAEGEMGYNSTFGENLKNSLVWPFIWQRGSFLSTARRKLFVCFAELEHQFV